MEIKLKRIADNGDASISLFYIDLKIKVEINITAHILTIRKCHKGFPFNQCSLKRCTIFSRLKGGLL